MKQSDFPQIKNMVEIIRDKFGQEVRPSYIEENGKKAGKLREQEGWRRLLKFIDYRIKRNG